MEYTGDQEHLPECCPKCKSKTIDANFDGLIWIHKVRGKWRITNAYSHDQSAILSCSRCGYEWAI